MSKIKAGFNSEKDKEGQTIGASEIRIQHKNAYEAMGLKRPPSQVPDYIRKKRTG